ncbi:unnamed protein product [Cuscuta campestris]|uniref:Uncharacterized protein n=1 Tax=Cuscuta campestris TaxID=132261 RepID=A0A484KTG1_9ASTE|nr:unnamed protein product [Cuscuta campestris]
MVRRKEQDTSDMMRPPWLRCRGLGKMVGEMSGGVAGGNGRAGGNIWDYVMEELAATIGTGSGLRNLLSFSTISALRV